MANLDNTHNESAGVQLIPRMQQTLTAEEIELIKKTVAPTATELELRLFLRFCERTGLDPLARQIYFVKRGTGDRARGVIQIGIDGFRLIADRTGQYAGSDEPVFEYKGDARIPHKATVTVWKIVGGIRCPFTACAFWDEYAPYYGGAPAEMWQKMPKGQLAKCAEALALRKAFPMELSGVYAHEEMAQSGCTVDSETGEIIEHHVQQPPPPSSQPLEAVPGPGTLSRPLEAVPGLGTSQPLEAVPGPGTSQPLEAVPGPGTLPEFPPTARKILSSPEAYSAMKAFQQTCRENGLAANNHTDLLKIIHHIGPDCRIPIKETVYDYTVEEWEEMSAYVQSEAREFGKDDEEDLELVVQETDTPEQNTETNDWSDDPEWRKKITQLNDSLRGLVHKYNDERWTNNREFVHWLLHRLLDVRAESLKHVPPDVLGKLTRSIMRLSEETRKKLPDEFAMGVNEKEVEA